MAGASEGALYLAVEGFGTVERAILLAFLVGAMTIGSFGAAAADCGLNTYPPFSGYGYDSDQCKMSWRNLDWNKVIRSCTSDAQDASADRRDFSSLAVAAQSWAKVAIGYDKIGRSDLANEARRSALSEIQAAIAGFKGEKPTPDDDNAERASALQASITAPNFYSSSGCGP